MTRLAPEFVELASPQLKEGVLYVSMVYGSAVHKCCDGCGEKVVTPFSPADWKLTFDGGTVSLHPSIGNWSFKCRSHYWIRENEIHWAPAWTDDQIEAGRRPDGNSKSNYFQFRRRKSERQAPGAAAQGSRPSVAAPRALGARVADWLRGLFKAP